MKPLSVGVIWLVVNLVSVMSKNTNQIAAKFSGTGSTRGVSVSVCVCVCVCVLT